MYVLDTNVISELRQGKREQAANVLSWAAGTGLSAQYLTSITIFELELGILQLERRGQGPQLRTWFEGLRTTFKGRVFPFSETAAMICAQLHSPNPKSFRDAMMAAIALEHGFTLVTRNLRDFQHTGVRLLDPWSN